MTTIAFDHRIFSQQRFGGVSRYICEIAERVPRRAGWRSCIIAPLHYNEHLAGSEASRLGLHLGARFRGSGMLCRAVSGLLGPPTLAALGADLVHLTYYCARPPSTAGRLVVTVHDMIHELFPSSFSSDDPTHEHKRRCVSAADRVLCVSHSTANDLVQMLDVPREKIVVTHLGFSDAFRRTTLDNTAMKPNGRRPYLLYVGHRGGYKNFKSLLDAYAASSRLRSDFDLIVFGGGPFTSTELMHVQSLRLRPDAIRRETGEDLALARAYAGAHIFIYPSKYEGFGIPPLEAMSSGCPVACSNVRSRTT